MRSERIKIQREYGPWLKAKSSNIFSTKNDRQKMLSKETIVIERKELLNSDQCNKPVGSGLGGEEQMIAMCDKDGRR